MWLLIEDGGYDFVVKENIFWDIFVFGVVFDKVCKDVIVFGNKLIFK